MIGAMHRSLQLLLAALSLLPIASPCETAEENLTRAAAALEAASPRAQADPSRPIFHVMAPAQWMNDPNGPLFYRGYYHLFYQLHPFSDGDGTKYWGHVRSRDLVKWERLPIALAPSNDKGEEAIWSGSCTINGLGQPMIFYTSIAQHKSAFDHAEQWAAIGDQDLIHWRKSDANPVLSEALNGDTKIYDWRDPFVFHDGKKTFLVAGGHLEKKGDAAVNIYEAQNRELTQWKYRGVLFHIPDAPTAECPNFFKLGRRWVLFVSPYGKVQYFVGDFDAKECRFTPRTHGLVDCGPSFYAPNTMLLQNGERLVWGWVNGFPNGHGWNGCLSVPRRLSLTGDGQLRQTPAPQLAGLRGKAEVWRNLQLQAQDATLPLPGTNTLEILAQIEMDKTTALALELRPDDSQLKPIALGLDGQQLIVAGVKAPLPASVTGTRKLELRLFVDRSVLEVVVGNTVWVTKTIPSLAGKASLSVHATNGRPVLRLVQAWPLNTIW